VKDLNQEGELMIQQDILPFKMERTDELITPRSGLGLFAEVVRTLGVPGKIREAFPRPGSNRGYEAWQYIEPLLLMLTGGGRHIEDLREIRDDKALRVLVGLRRMPSLSTFGDWLVRTGASGGLRAITAVDEGVAGAIWRRTGTADYTLDVDATVIEAEKKEAAMTYKGLRGYQPQLGYLAEDGKPTDREVGTAVHLMGGARLPFRLVIQRWREAQLNLFEPQGYRHYVIATNRDELSAVEVVRFHNKRGQVENSIKELKLGFGMEQMTSEDFRANALWFALGVLASNLVQGMKLLFLDPEWTSKTVATLRWQLIQVAGRLIRHGRGLILRLAASLDKFSVLVELRRQVVAFR
jgi:hypothetical protein